MSVVTAFGALEAMRCENVPADRHYGLAAAVPAVVSTPCLAWSYSFRENWSFEPEVYDFQAGVLGVGVSFTLATAPYRGVWMEGDAVQLAMWADRVTLMLGADMLLGDSLAAPLSGYMRELGIIEWRRESYFGLVMDLLLNVRIDVP